MNQLFREIIVDNFAGGGGASTGIELATGRSVDIAINHDPDAIAMHKTNHPSTEHYCESVWDISPREAVKGRPVALCWLSPDCKHFSKAKGGKPVEKKIRGLAWVAVRWAATVKPRVIMLENVEEFQTWGPLTPDGMPCPNRKGKTFQAFVNALNRQGYKVDWKELRACDYGAPTIRKRLFLIARRDGKPIVWPTPTHGDPKSPEVKSGKLKPWRTAAECIDWSIPCPSIFERKRPLAENTMKRIAKGLKKFVFDSGNPFIIGCGGPKYGAKPLPIESPLNTVCMTPHSTLIKPVLAPFITEHANASSQRNMPAEAPLRTQCAQVKGGHFALVAPIIARQFGNSVGSELDAPIGTVTAGGGGKSQLVAAFLAKHYGGNYKGAGASPEVPLPTVTTTDHNALVTSHMIKLRGSNTGHRADEPMHTVTAGGLHLGEVRAFLLKYYGTNIGLPMNEPVHTVTTKERFGIVTVQGEQYQIVDIGMRMLQPHELFAAQGFPDDYIIDVDHDGNKYSKSKQVARCGNSVPPPFAEHLVRSNLPEMCSGGRYYDAVSHRAI